MERRAGILRPELRGQGRVGLVGDDYAFSVLLYTGECITFLPSKTLTLTVLV